jgi:AdoMet-dependent rRNA methyltransferase SPB1
LLSKSTGLLDLCAAPGGWLQVAAKYMPVSSKIVGVDLVQIKPMPRVVCLQEDITTQHCRALLRKEFKGIELDIVVHDGAPNVGGSTWHKDAYVQNELVLHSLKLATEFLKLGGSFVTKVFRSQDYNSLMWCIQQFFKTVEVCKPASSRAASAETFLVCQGYLAPKKIDPRLLDPTHVFKVRLGCLMFCVAD